MFYEFEVVTLFRTIGVVGFAVHVGIYALLSWRIIGGDSLAFFAGNTVAAALILGSNVGAFHTGWVLVQIAFVALGMGTMILIFLSQNRADRTAPCDRSI